MFLTVLFLDCDVKNRVDLAAAIHLINFASSCKEFFLNKDCWSNLNGRVVVVSRADGNLSLHILVAQWNSSCSNVKNVFS